MDASVTMKLQIGPVKPRNCRCAALQLFKYFLAYTLTSRVYMYTCRPCDSVYLLRVSQKRVLMSNLFCPFLFTPIVIDIKTQASPMSDLPGSRMSVNPAASTCGVIASMSSDAEGGFGVACSSRFDNGSRVLQYFHRKCHQCLH